MAVQAQQRPAELKITSPERDSIRVLNRTNYFRGIATPGSQLFLNDEAVTVYKTGVFAAAMPVDTGLNVFDVVHVVGGDTSRRQLMLYYERPAPQQPTPGFAIEYVKIFPGDEIWLQAGDHLQVEMKATPGQHATFYQGVPMHEMDSIEAGVAGIYRGEYVVRETDVMERSNLTFALENIAEKKVVRQVSQQQVTFLTNRPTVVGTTNSARTALLYGLGGDRLGGAKMGELAQGVRLEVTGKMQSKYRVRLSETAQAFVDERDLTLLSGVQFRPSSIAGSWSVRTDNVYDYVSIGLGMRLPYVSLMEQNPSRIVIDVYGAVSNSNWITQRQGLLAISNVWYEQLEKDIFRVFIELKKDQHWGYEVGYQGNSLTIKVKPQPKSLRLRDLTIAVDAGHGGSNRGAVGMTGVQEKVLNLDFAKALEAQLKSKGAQVIMTRTGDQAVSNAERVRRLTQQKPDLLISIHCNAAANPLAQGTSTYYRHQAFRPLSQTIYDELLKLDLADFGNVGGFNFVLNAPTEFPSVLVEVAFMSNPSDEERLLEPTFSKDVAEAIVKGVETFLAGLAD